MARRSDAYYRFEYLLYRGVQRSLLAMSPASIRGFGRRLGGLTYYLLAPKRRLALRNLRLALPALGETRHRAIARGCFQNFGITFCEIATAEHLRPETVEQRFRVEGWENLDAADAQGRGVFVLSGHFGAFEQMAYALSHHMGSLHLVVRPPNNPLVDRDINRVRQRCGIETILKSGAGQRMRTVVRKGGRVGILIDQRVREGGIDVPFFGHPSPTTPLVAFLAIRTGTPVVPVFAVAEGRDGYFLRIDPAIDLRDYEASREGEFAATQQLLGLIEAEIRRQPEQWLWMHRRWRS